MSHYDPNQDPDPSKWLALDDEERVRVIARHHRSPACDHPPAGDPEVHARVHAIIESQIALGGETPVAATLQRLRREGLSRHQALHAIGSVLARHLFHMMEQPEENGEDINEAYFRDVQELSADRWLASGDDEEDEIMGAHAHEDDDSLLEGESGLDEILGPIEIDAALAAQLTDEELVGFLDTGEDRIGHSVIDAILARKEGTTPVLLEIAGDRTAWESGTTWAPVHATFLIASLPETRFDAPLLESMRFAERFQVDWVTDMMPSILGSRGSRLRPALAEIAESRRESDTLRSLALASLAATTLTEADGADAVFGSIAAVVADPTESGELRFDAAMILLDFNAEAHRGAVDAFAEGRGAELMSSLEVDELWDMGPMLDSYRMHWLEFYDEEHIRARQERWLEGEDLEDDDDDESDPDFEDDFDDDLEDNDEDELIDDLDEDDARPLSSLDSPCPCGSGRKYWECCLPGGSRS